MNLVTIVEPEDSLVYTVRALVVRDDVERVVVRIVLAGCYRFTATKHD